MSKSYELRTLRELVKLFENSPERVKAYRRTSLIISTASSLTLILAVVLTFGEIVDARYAAILVLVAGIGIGVELMYRLLTSDSMLIVRYTSLREDEISKRIEELETR